MPEANTAEESLRQWSAVASAWDRYSDRLFKDVRSVSEWLVDQVNPQPGQTVLELTAGTGETGFLAAGRLDATGRLISSDFVPAMVEAARRRAGEQGLDNVECRVLDAQQIDLPDDSVDGVMSRFGMMLVPAQQRAIAEIRRVLRQGGRCAYATWGLPEHNPWIFQIVAALLQNGVTPPGDPFAPGGIFSLATLDSNRALAAGGGFTDITVEELPGTMVFDGPDDYWTHVTEAAGPVATLVASLDAEQVTAIRATLDPSLAPFDHDGALELPWLAAVTSAA
ncbi:class I SAM-dependent methyltransferase [Mycobacterium noviomagense]|nr:methyltransferase domain-containing protein [Mycobacterium noviomagense]BBY06935.1 methyltransferase [Mycobacterium noviomagense]